jgi:molybdopterin converting factor small subunit
LIGTPEQTVECDASARVGDVWRVLTARAPALEALAGSTRAARNGRLVSFDEALSDGDELSLLPPVGGG